MYVFDSKFELRKLCLHVALMLPLSVIVVHILMSGMSVRMLLITTAMVLLALGFMLWKMMDTRYSVEGDLLYFRSGPRRGSFAISSIQRVRRNMSWMPLGDAARSVSGLTIFFQYGQVFISPVNEEQFIGLLQKINPRIRIET